MSSTPIDMSPGNCSIDYSIPYHWIMEYSPFVSVWFYIYIIFFVVEQNGSLKLSHQHAAILNHHFWNLIHQIYVCIFYRPVAHLPMFGFQIGGVVRSWDLNAIELWIVWKYNSRIIFCPDFAIVDLSMWQTILPNALAAFGLGLLFFIMVFMGIASLIVLSTKSSGASIKTLRTQKMLMQSFVIQVFTHTVFLFLPAVTCAILALFSRLSNVAIYTAIFCLVHQGVITIIVFAICTPISTKAAKSCNSQLIRFVHFLLSVIRWFLCCGLLKKNEEMPSLVQVNVAAIAKWSPHPTTQTHTTTHML
ncbi:hypothetical protein GCK72_020594 [Caenorhabditis remanei]|uniref:Uncharacterized protein n=1 Tax=Caenorhabditis remanei TaxID=31234 RepID=A0A6A5GH95_CAERE|nr:hypothetical protein GCK72_020594 [Caenorhabditis remanei]KAF1754036.1 hypothetical protein GCK72_020594 [Caenorhabditis remanei]